MQIVKKLDLETIDFYLPDGWKVKLSTGEYLTCEKGKVHKIVKENEKNFFSVWLHGSENTTYIPNDFLPLVYSILSPNESIEYLVKESNYSSKQEFFQNFLDSLPLLETFPETFDNTKQNIGLFELEKYFNKVKNLVVWVLENRQTELNSFFTDLDLKEISIPNDYRKDLILSILLELEASHENN